eukprot:365931-Chlamydomonas_euryale.AAC.4
MRAASTAGSVYEPSTPARTCHKLHSSYSLNRFADSQHHAPQRTLKPSNPYLCLVIHQRQAVLIHCIGIKRLVVHAAARHIRGALQSRERRLDHALTVQQIQHFSYPQLSTDLPAAWLLATPGAHLEKAIPGCSSGQGSEHNVHTGFQHPPRTPSHRAAPPRPCCPQHPPRRLALTQYSPTSSMLTTTPAEDTRPHVAQPHRGHVVHNTRRGDLPSR